MKSSTSSVYKADIIGRISNRKPGYCRSSALATGGTKCLKMQHYRLSTRQDGDTGKENMRRMAEKQRDNFIQLLQEGLRNQRWRTVPTSVAPGM